MQAYRPFTALGIIMILVGVIFVAIPIIARHIPEIEKIPWIILWVYRSNGFTFATSPILIIISVISLLFNILRARG